MTNQAMVSRFMIYKDFIYNVRHDLRVNNHDTDALFLEIINEESKKYFY